MAAFARRFGAEPPAAVVERRATRSLEEIATENAVEGCVRETFGALVAMWQAERAEDRTVAGAMKKIAEDELRHASLAWEIAEWIDTRLDAAARKRVERARRAAARELLRDAGQSVPREVIALAGLPDAAAAKTLARGMTRALA
jgi:RNA polymerase-interacting CarD/CdnL/TRCF family regulator